MIRAYDDYGNVVDIVALESETYNKALDDVIFQFQNTWDNSFTFKEIKEKVNYIRKEQNMTREQALLKGRKQGYLKALKMVQDLIFRIDNMDIREKMFLHDTLTMYGESVDSITERIEDDELLV